MLQSIPILASAQIFTNAHIRVPDPIFVEATNAVGCRVTSFKNSPFINAPQQSLSMRHNSHLIFRHMRSHLKCGQKIYFTQVNRRSKNNTT